MEKIELHVFLHGPDSSGIMTELADIKRILGELKMDDAQLGVLLDTINVRTTEIGTNVTNMGSTALVIKKELETLVAATPVGTPISQANVDKLNGLAQIASDLSNATKAQADVLTGIAAEGGTTVPPSPVPVPPPVPVVG